MIEGKDSMVNKNDERGDDHVGSSAITPLRADAFDISDEENDSVTAIQDLKIAKAKLEKVSKAEPTDIKEDEDKEPSKSDIKKTKGLAKAKEELALLTREMKSLAKKYSKAEGEEKEKLVKVLKDKTKLKKELESILDKKKI